MFQKINVIEIFRNHLGTLKSNKTDKAHIPDIILFLLIPFLISSILIFYNHLLTKELANIIATSFSVFAGLLLNLLLLVFDLADKEENKKNERITSVLKQLYSNIAFCILISVIIVFSLFSLFLDITYDWYIQGLSWLVYYLLLVFMLTLIMVIKRIDKMLSIKFK